MTLRRSRLAAGAVALVCVPVVLFPTTTQARAVPVGPDCESIGPDDRDLPAVTGDNDANDALQVTEATALARKQRKGPGEGVTVVVVDSGIDGLNSGAPSGFESGHGYVVGGIIGGARQPGSDLTVGIAPDARLVEGKFYDVPRGSENEDQTVPMSGILANQLNAITNSRKGALKGRTIVVIPTEVMRTDALEKAVDRLVASGALVIAAAGDRPEGNSAEDESFLKAYAGEARPGEDAAADVWPAADEGVISVGVSEPGAISTVLRNSGVDLAAPGVNAVARALNGKWCAVTTISSHWAAAQVAGVAALVWSVHDGDSAAELRARLQGTASGNGADASPLTGYGVVQPVEAIQRDLDGMGAEGHEDDAVPRAKVPPERADLLASARENSVWWGLGGGGALVILLVLRPVLARRRH